MSAAREAIRQPSALRGELRLHEPMAEHTSWRVGGPAERFYLPADLDDLVMFLGQLPPDEPLFWVGLGSNLLVRDGGIRGTVICTRNRLKNLRALAEDRIYVEAGVPCGHVAKFCAERQLDGAEFLAGIPGTLGGALAMNAGAFGGETWPWVERVVTLDRHGTLRRRTPTDYTVGYRSVRGPAGEWFVAAELKLVRNEDSAGRDKIKALLARRNETQPTNLPSCGSVFRNPEGDFAARLIEAVGLKGFRIGGACVSEKHANFIINTGAATAADIEALVLHVRDTVRQQQGRELIPEVKIVGVAPASGAIE
ncbi:UDP-N-acetylmuramate dehydrogenase [Methylomagnum ishizawai]|uniref:UDP-N-acetylenolpyruvoylglucosamine reductase n=1 Tax=Methylomagnum ishizawai TaxID=1760988 RepID=A0A1Y6CZQ7_9GAMM|nr:UDP-N-acetylmuramate dehydrogenase [Methylomagnum ishizawai]SMF93792.1 UDP-N-acetylmuramate dehydrogenase [Methylomagnum ishizawai]